MTPAGSFKADVDLAILGGGCAGLSLARRLTASKQRVAIIEPRGSYRADRTWAFWEDSDADPWVKGLIERRWPAWQLGSAGPQVEHLSAERPYAVVPSMRLYDNVLCAIDGNTNVSLLRGTQALGLSETSSNVAIETSRGRLHASFVVDARPPHQGKTARSILFQSFRGVEIETERPVFEDRTVELMTDMRVDEGGFVFTYVLPFSASRALVEVTRFITTPCLPCSLDTDLSQAITARVDGSSYRILRREQGVLPMGLEPVQAKGERIVNAGTAAGAGRAATGYAFMRIQRWARACARAIEIDGRPIGHPPEPPLRHAMDRLFLRVLRDEPERAPRLFLALGQGLAANTFARFLSDQAGPRELAAVIAALPPVPFLRKLMAHRPTGGGSLRRRTA